MNADTAGRRSQELGERVAALASALHAAGADPDAAARLLGAASAAALHALTLELLLDPPGPLGDAPGDDTPSEHPPVPLAA
jgi:hypothetical protein